VQIQLNFQFSKKKLRNFGMIHININIINDPRHMRRLQCNIPILFKNMFLLQYLILNKLYIVIKVNISYTYRYIFRTMADEK